MHQQHLDALTQAIAETADLLAKLQRELAAGREEQREQIIKSFDDGGSRRQVCEAFGVNYDRVTNVLAKAGRCERQRRAIPLSADQRPHYERLLRQGIGSRLAKQIAETVAP